MYLHVLVVFQVAEQLGCNEKVLTRVCGASNIYHAGVYESAHIQSVTL